jgi:hypothetical protein
MSNRVAIVLSSYNMTERVDHLYEWVEANVKWPHDWVIVDSGSDLVMPSEHTTLRMRKTQEMMTAFRLGQVYAEGMEATNGEDYRAFWFLTSSVRFPAPETYPQDILEGLMLDLLNTPGAVGVHPALYNPVPGLAWTCLLQQPGNTLRRVWGIEITAMLVDAAWWKSGDWVNPKLRIGWGLMMDACYQARREGLGFYVDDAFPMHKDQGLVEKMGRRGSRADRDSEGSRTMQAVLEAKYGSDYLTMLGRDYTQPEWF